MATAATTGRSFNCHKTTVQRIIQLCASAHLYMQSALFQCLVPPIETLSSIAGKQRLVFFSSLWFDETQHSMSIRTNLSLSSSQQVSQWTIMIALSSLLAVLIASDGQTEVTRSNITGISALRAPVIVITTSAACLFHALFAMPANKAFEDVCQQMDAIADIPVRCYSCDGAASNYKCLAHACTKLPNTLKSMKRCSLHVHKTIEVSLTVFFGLSTISMMYSMSLVLRQGGFFLRLLHSVVPFVRSRLVMVRGDPPASHRKYASQLVDPRVAPSAAEPCVFFAVRLKHIRNNKNILVGFSRTLWFALEFRLKFVKLLDCLPRLEWSWFSCFTSST